MRRMSLSFGVLAFHSVQYAHACALRGLAAEGAALFRPTSPALFRPTSPTFHRCVARGIYPAGWGGVDVVDSVAGDRRVNMRCNTLRYCTLRGLFIAAQPIAQTLIQIPPLPTALTLSRDSARAGLGDVESVRKKTMGYARGAPPILRALI